MDIDLLTEKLNMGYGKAALRLGREFGVFRAPSLLTPLDPANQIATIRATFSTNLQFNKPAKPTDAILYMMADATDLQVGDWLSNANDTFFVSELQDIVPHTAVRCYTTVDIIRPGEPGQEVGGGFAPTEVLIAQSLPVFMMSKKDKSGAPNFYPVATDSTSAVPEWQLYINARNVGDIQAHDIVVGQDLDADGNPLRYVIDTLIRTPAGFIVTAKLEKP